MILLAGVGFLLFPVAVIFFSSSHDTATLARDGLQISFGDNARENYKAVFSLSGGFFDQITAATMLKNSLIIGTGVASLTTAFSILSAYAIVYLKFPMANLLFWVIFATLLFPLESRFVTTFQITAYLGLINTHLGIILPTLAAALGTFFFRQFFLTLPEELAEAARMDGAGPLRFFWDFILPLSWARAGAVFVVSFMIGWNQFLWPLMISTDESLYTLVRGIRFIGQESGPGMALVVISMLPPFVLLLAFQRWFFSNLAGSNVQSSDRHG